MSATCCRGAQKSLTAGFHYTIRDFRLMLSVAFPGPASDLNRRDELALRDSMASTLRSASLLNRVCDAADLINWCALFTNPDRISQTDALTCTTTTGASCATRSWTSTLSRIPIRAASPSGRKRAPTCWRPASLNQELSGTLRAMADGLPIGDLMQPALQYSAPFLLTLGVHVLDPNIIKSVVTASHVRATQNAKSKMADVMPDVKKKLDDWTAAADAIDTGGSLVSLYHQLALFTTAQGRRSPPTGRQRHLARPRLPAQRRRLHAPPGVAGQPPMTLTEKFHKDLVKMRRVTRKTMANAIHMAPLIAEWRGTRTGLGLRRRPRPVDDPGHLRQRPGQLQLRHHRRPGSGKSVLMNEMAWSTVPSAPRSGCSTSGAPSEKLCRKARAPTSSSARTSTSASTRLPHRRHQ